MGAIAHTHSTSRGIAQFRSPVLRSHDLAVPDLDPAHEGLRIAQLSDIHVGLLTPQKRIRRAIDTIRALEPDIVVLTGDYVCYDKKFVTRFEELIGGLPGQVFAVLGNHDYWTDGPGVKKAIERCGYEVLANQHTRREFNGKPLVIAGVDDPVTKRHDVGKTFQGASHALTRIVLCHAPHAADQIASHGPAFILAGHTHGGHINIPKVTNHLAQKLGARYLAGFYPIEESLLYVNCGIGGSSIPVRVRAPSEVALFTLRSTRPGTRLRKRTRPFPH